VTDLSFADERNEALLAWYADHRRDLPWRSTRDPYPILVAEVMSQQTQIIRVVAHWELFMVVFPTVEDLAAAPLASVLRAWSGLGYNTRAKWLHEAAQDIARSGWPATSEGLAALPGVGSYTARAVAAFAFGERVAAVDTNLRRVLGRWHGERLDGTALELAAADSLGDDASSWNQAVMDLGATLCKPRDPACSLCPVAAWCTGPDVYEPPRAQARFEGSKRQVRGAIVRSLARGATTFDDLVAAIGFSPDQVDDAVALLVAEGLVDEAEDGTLQLPD
jgi:A/G-specific adenine glycosylase